MHRSLRLASLLLIALAGPALAQRAAEGDGKGPAYTEPPADDPNYPLMGEFIGEIQAGEGDTQRLGLQIRAVGRNEFDALSFLGGLPGQEGHQGEPVRMIGRRSDDFVILSGGPVAIIVEADACLLIDRQGNRVGKLDRIQRTSPTLGAPPPKDAIVLFDGTNLDQFTNAQMTEEGLLMQGADIKPMFQDFNLHAEFRVPYMPQADGQSRGNSGLYLQSRYECQILDSFALDPLYNGLGSLYRFKAPDVNMSFPPLVWQTYDVQFTAPRWAADGSKIRDAHVTTWINGVKVQDDVPLPDKTGAGKQEEPLLLPTRIQDHGDPVRFRNIWVVDRGLTSGAFPIVPTEEERLAAEQERKAKADAAQKQAAEKQAAEKEAAEKPKAEASKPEPADAKESPESQGKPAGDATDKPAAEEAKADQPEESAEGKTGQPAPAPAPQEEAAAEAQPANPSR